MSSLRLPPSLRIFLGILTTVALFTIYRSSSPHSPGKAFIAESLQMESRDASGPVPGLEVSLHQSKSSPPTITTTVTNKNRYAVTFLSYDSPLDSLALQLGLLSITPAGASTPLELPIIQVRRFWPPKRDSLISIAPGASKKLDIALDESIVPMDKVGSKPSVTLTGKWGHVLAKSKDGISDADLENIGSSSDEYSGKFASNNLEVIIG
ncbi:hypothetical protein TOPH_04662 [Tolypocladium ophioglossoides CBS 100239]|uniref:Uncharacterized protein n=1 Tax=Tolypocladium ophioglossoides (strain CBS 100239) TaxID=1163406 RepID=A0A0L0N8Z4_TOLOC|nr:hypothetical protein TOPH_04662 [Tolypocladium ophioglossoides CBS 100239]